MKKIGREKRIPFELSAETSNAETLMAVKEAEQIMAHPEEYRSYSSFDEILGELD